MKKMILSITLMMMTSNVAVKHLKQHHLTKNMAQWGSCAPCALYTSLKHLGFGSLTPDEMINRFCEVTPFCPPGTRGAADKEIIAVTKSFGFKAKKIECGSSETAFREMRDSLIQKKQVILFPPDHAVSVFELYLGKYKVMDPDDRREHQLMGKRALLNLWSWGSCTISLHVSHHFARPFEGLIIGP